MLSHNRPRRDAVSSLKNKSLTSLKGTHKTPDSTSTLKWWHQDGGLLDRVTEHKGKIKMGERKQERQKSAEGSKFEETKKNIWQT